MVMGRRCFVHFRFEDKGRSLHMLETAIDQASRDSRKERGEHNSPNHVKFPWLVAGKADGVARVVGRVVGSTHVRQADAGTRVQRRRTGKPRRVSAAKR